MTSCYVVVARKLSTVLKQLLIQPTPNFGKSDFDMFTCVQKIVTVSGQSIQEYIKDQTIIESEWLDHLMMSDNQFIILPLINYKKWGLKPVFPFFSLALYFIPTNSSLIKNFQTVKPRIQ